MLPTCDALAVTERAGLTLAYANLGSQAARPLMWHGVRTESRSTVLRRGGLLSGTATQHLTQHTG